MSAWIDVTTSVSCPPPYVGITRVESNLARKLCEAGAKVRACFYEASIDRFSELPVAELMRVMQLHRSTEALRAPIQLQVDRHDRSSNGGLDVFDRGDVVISCGLNWRREYGNMGRLYAFRNSIGLKVVT